VLVLYTDGVIEARRDGALFGEERLRGLVSQMVGVGPREMPRRLFGEVMRYTGGVLNDDLAVLTVSVTGDTPGES
jgi:serine phosphatase RsbU (regulator of sigma subunit)